MKLIFTSYIKVKSDSTYIVFNCLIARFFRTFITVVCTNRIYPIVGFYPMYKKRVTSKSFPLDLSGEPYTALHKAAQEAQNQHEKKKKNDQKKRSKKRSNKNAAT